MAPEVIPVVIDNASIDKSVDVARSAGVEVIVNLENRGFAAAVNQGFRATQAGLGLLLNPDVRLSTPIHELAAAAADQGLAAGQLTDAHGRPQAGFTIRRLPTAAALCLELLGINRICRNNPVNRWYRYMDRDLSLPGTVEQPAGAFLMVRRDIWKRLGGFDEGFHPVWFEDVDFCRRAVDEGFQIQYVPAVRAMHEGGHSVLKLPIGCRTRYWYGSLLRYAGKHLRPPAYRAVWLAAVLGAIPRTVLGMIQQKSLRPAKVVFEILNLSGASYPSRARQAKTGQGK